MTANTFTMLPGRGLLGVGGADAIDFLQNLISNDVERVAPDTSIYALLLTAQGKFLHDFFVIESADVETASERDLWSSGYVGLP